MLFDRDAFRISIFLLGICPKGFAQFWNIYNFGKEILFMKDTVSPNHTSLPRTSATRTLAIAGVFTAVAVVGSFLSVPVAGSKCAPVQHMVNILSAVILGPAGVLALPLCQSDPQSFRHRQSDGISGKYGGRTLLRPGLQIQ